MDALVPQYHSFFFEKMAFGSDQLRNMLTSFARLLDPGNVAQLVAAARSLTRGGLLRNPARTRAVARHEPRERVDHDGSERLLESWEHISLVNFKVSQRDIGDCDIPTFCLDLAILCP